MRDTCPSCRSKTAFQEFEKNSYCHKCGYIKKHGKSLFKKEEQPCINDRQYSGRFLKGFPSRVLWQLSKYGLTKELLEKHKVKYCEKLIYKEIDRGERVIFPKYHIDDTILFFEAKTTGGDPIKWISHPNKNIPYKAYDIEPTEVIITEDIISAIRVNEIFPAMALRGLKMSDNLLAELVRYKDKVTLWLDGDLPGIQAARKLKRRLELYLPVTVISTEKDPKMYTNEEIEKWVKLSNT